MVSSISPEASGRLAQACNGGGKEKSDPFEVGFPRVCASLVAAALLLSCYVHRINKAVPIKIPMHCIRLIFLHPQKPRIERPLICKAIGYICSLQISN